VKLLIRAKGIAPLLSSDVMPGFESNLCQILILP